MICKFRSSSMYLPVVTESSASISTSIKVLKEKSAQTHELMAMRLASIMEWPLPRSFFTITY